MATIFLSANSLKPSEPKATDSFDPSTETSIEDTKNLYWLDNY
jgi:hypothetical protein